MKIIMDKILRCYTRLEALKKNLPNDHKIHEKFIEDYHEILRIISEEARIELDEFNIPNIEIKPKLTSSNYLTREKHYSKDNYCDKAIFLSKLDALLSYFQFKYLSQEKPQIGFKTENI